MDKNTLQLSIASAEANIFCGQVIGLQITGSEGEMGILPGHTPLLTALKPGMVRLTVPSGEHQVIYLSGGVMEVQPHKVTVLADTAIRADKLDEQAAREAKRRAQQQIARPSVDIDYAEVTAQLARAVAQLRAIQEARKQINRLKR
jgi:F-type H+-transporting ATPase subunit epsilon